MLKAARFRTGSAACLLLAATHGVAAAQQATVAPMSSETTATQVDEIVVTGYARSLQRASNLKRLADHSLDAVTAEDIGNLAAFLLSPGAGWLSGQTIALDGGNWLSPGGGFREQLEWGDAEWATARARISARTAADKTMS